MITKDGTYRAKAFEAMLGTSKEKGTPFVGVKFRVLEGDGAGQVLRWEGWLSDKAGSSGKTVAERTIESLQTCGWKGDDLSELARTLNGLDANEVDLVVEMEPGFNDPTKSYPKVKWVNRIGNGGTFAGETMDVAQAAEFGRKYRGLAMTLRAKGGNGAAKPAATQTQMAGAETIDDIPF